MLPCSVPLQLTVGGNNRDDGMDGVSSSCKTSVSSENRPCESGIINSLMALVLLIEKDPNN